VLDVFFVGLKASSVAVIRHIGGTGWFRLEKCSGSGSVCFWASWIRKLFDSTSNINKKKKLREKN
jgi:hypothetical protein